MKKQLRLQTGLCNEMLDRGTLTKQHLCVNYGLSVFDMLTETDYRNLKALESS